jgi:hypothetical protein
MVDWLYFDACATDRKFRLFSVAACEPLRLIIQSPRTFSALDAAEAFANSRISSAELLATYTAAWSHHRTRYGDAYGVIPAQVHNAEVVCLYPTTQDPHRDRKKYEAENDAPYALLIADFIDHPDSTKPSRPRLVRLLRDIFGPLPFRDIAAHPSWLTTDVLALARGIYDDKAFDRMPILADALQDAGCDNPDILSHCRVEGWEHVRGCWVIDLLLGRPWRESPSVSRREPAGSAPRPSTRSG